MAFRNPHFFVEWVGTFCINLWFIYYIKIKIIYIMTRNNFRVGNFVKAFGRMQKILEIRKQGYILDGMGEFEVVRSEYVEGSMLGPKVLEEFGFENIGGLLLRKEIKGVGTLEVAWMSRDDVNIWVDNNNKGFFKCTYIHELQNVLFCVLKEEIIF